MVVGQLRLLNILLVFYSTNLALIYVVLISLPDNHSWRELPQVDVTGEEVTGWLHLLRLLIHFFLRNKNFVLVYWNILIYRRNITSVHLNVLLLVYIVEIILGFHFRTFFLNILTLVVFRPLGGEIIFDVLFLLNRL